MEISDKNPPISSNNYLKDVHKNPSQDALERKAAQPAGGDVKVELSPQSKEMLKAKNTMESIPEVRTEKVTDLKNQVENGTYSVDGKKIAVKMIRESILDVLA